MRDRVLLIVDDEVGVLRSLKRFLRKENYQIVTATGGEVTRTTSVSFVSIYI